MTVSRRTLLGGAAAGAGAGMTTLGPATHAAAAGRHRTADVVVIGAGFAGLTAADRLAAAGHDVLVLEARDRVGGRVRNLPLTETEPIEIGGQWVGPTQDALLALARDVGVATFPTYDTGDYIDHRNGMTYRYDGRIPYGAGVGAAEAGVVIERWNEMAGRVDTRQPWRAADAETWDAMTVATWLRDNVASEDGRDLIRLAFEAVWAAQPRDVSLLHAMFYIASAGSVEALVETSGGAQQDRFVGGSQLITQRLADRLGERVLLGTPVRRIVQHHDRVDVVTDRISVRAQRVVVAMPPALAGRIDYDPPLPARRDQLTQKMPMGSVIKVLCVYPEPFWRADGLAGQSTSDTGPVKLTFDNSPPDGSPGVLLGFFEGEAAREYSARTRAERQRGTVESFARYFGDQARGPLRYLEHDWQADPFSRGGYVGYTGPGVLLDHGRALREPAGRVHWAGTETATRWNGYMDGAVRSGHRVAEEVSPLLG
jgi:monoamine oxidase